MKKDNKANVLFGNAQRTRKSLSAWTGSSIKFIRRAQEYSAKYSGRVEPIGQKLKRKKEITREKRFITKETRICWKHL